MATTAHHRTTGFGRAASRAPAQWAALAFGAVYLLVGLAGWAVTSEFTGVDDDAQLLGFHLNGAHNVVHLALGLFWLAAATRLAWSRAINTLFGVVLVAVGVAGMTGVLDTLMNIKNAAEPDNYLHIATGALAVWFGTAGATRRS